MKTTNTKSSIYTTKKEEFKANNLFAEWTNGVYVVYSYGRHFPMFLYNPVKDKWFENKDKYSISTSKQQNQARPSYADTNLMSTTFMQMEIKYGFSSAKNVTIEKGGK